MTAQVNLLEVRNPLDLTTTYNQIEIQRGTTSSCSDMANISTSTTIDTSTANDLSTGFTSYTDSGGDTASYYRFRYKASVSGAVSAYSDIFQAGTTVMHTRFRRRMRDTNSANYFFTDADIDTMLGNSIKKLFPHTFNEVIDESLSTNGTTMKFSFPVGVNRVNDIEFLNSSGEVVQLSRNWKLRARQIIFDEAPTSGYTFRLYCDKMFKKLAEVPDIFDDLILDLMCLEAYQTMEADRTKYYRYQSVANPEGGNVPSIKGIIERLEVTTKNRLNSLRRVRRPSEIKLN